MLFLRIILTHRLGSRDKKRNKSSRPRLRVLRMRGTETDARESAEAMVGLEERGARARALGGRGVLSVAGGSFIS